MAVPISSAPNADQPIAISTDDQGRVVARAEDVRAVCDEWALAIGRFIVVFSQCEGWMHSYIRSYCTPQETIELNKMRLRQKLSTLRRFLIKKQLATETHEVLSQSIQRLRQLISTRHTIAHHAPMIQLTRHAETGALEVRHVLRSSRDASKDITVEQLNREFAEALLLEEQLALLYGRLQKEFRAKRSQLASKR